MFLSHIHVSCSLSLLLSLKLINRYSGGALKKEERKEKKERVVRIISNKHSNIEHLSCVHCTSDELDSTSKTQA